MMVSMMRDSAENRNSMKMSKPAQLALSNLATASEVENNQLFEGNDRNRSSPSDKLVDDIIQVTTRDSEHNK